MPASKKSPATPRAGAAKAVGNSPLAKTPAQRKALFDTIKPLLTPYIKGSVQVTEDNDKHYYLVSKKSVIDTQGKPRPEMSFAALMIHGGHVGFYLMHIYTHPEYVKELGPSLRKYLKGKSCFNLNTWNAELETEVKAALKTGYKLYKDAGWIS